MSTNDYLRQIVKTVHCYKFAGEILNGEDRGIEHLKLLILLQR